jgi:hypothetical protein
MYLIIPIKINVWVEQDQLRGLHGHPTSILLVFNYENFSFTIVHAAAI